MTHINLTDFNNTNDRREAVLKYEKKLQGGPYDYLYCTKFRLQSQIPIFIPKLLKSNNTTLTIPSATEVLPTKELSKYPMNWSICVHDVTQNRYVNMPVYWKPQMDFSSEPLNFPNRIETINNPYFYAYNSIHVITCIQNTLTEIGNLLGKIHPIEIIKNESSYQLLILNTEKMKVYFNYELAQVFAFHYTTTDYRGRYSEIVFDNRNALKYASKNYIFSQVLSLTTRMFPFSDIQFVSSNLKIQNVEETITTNLEVPNSVPIILSYTLNVDDVDSVVDNLNFSINTVNHGVELVNSNFPDRFYIKAHFKTFDNYYLPVMLDTNDSLNMYIIFK